MNGFGVSIMEAYCRVNLAPSEKRTRCAHIMLDELMHTPTRYPVAEAGVFTGMTAFLLCRYMGKKSVYHGFDSFEGLEPGPQDEGAHPACVKGWFSKSPKFAREAVSEFRAEIHVGHIPEVFREQKNFTYRFVHVDVDCYAPTLESLRYFYPRLARGGVMICDDYSWTGARAACEEFGREFVVEGDQAIWRKS